MLRSRFLLACISLALTACAEPHDLPGTVEWARTFGALGSADPPLIAVDASGHIGLASDYVGTPLPFGQPLPPPESAASFVATLSAEGRTRWVFPIADPGDKKVYGLAATPDGDWLVGGSFRGSLDTGEGTVSEAVDADMFLIALDSAGRPRWHRHFGADLGGPSGSGSLVPTGGIAVAPNGDIAVAGLFWGTIGFGGPALDPDAKSAATSPAKPFVAMLDARGGERWALAMSGNVQSLNKVAVDARGDVLIAGAYSVRLGLGEHEITTGSSTDSTLHGFVGKLGAGGEPRWLVDIADEQIAMANGVASDAQGHVLAVGTCMTTLRVGGLEGRGCNAFVLALSSDGEPLWLHALSPALDAVAVTTGDDGDVILTGIQIQDGPDFGLGPLPARDTPGFYVAAYDGDGHAVEGSAFGAASTWSDGQAIANASAHEVVVAGQCIGNLGIGGLDPHDPSTQDGLFVARVAR